MKKILFVTDSFLPLVDGVSRFSADILKSLSQDFDFTLLAPDYGLRLNSYHNIPVTYFRPTRLIRVKAGLEYRPVFPNIFKVIRAVKKSDAVFVQTLPYLGAASILAAKLYKKPVAMYFHQIGWEQLKLVVPGASWFKELIKHFALFQIRIISNMCDCILVPSPELIDLLNEAGIKSKKIVVNMGVDTERFAPVKNKASAKSKLELNPKTLVIGYCGRMSDEKNVITLIKAFLRLSKKRKNLYLLLVGGGERFEKTTLRNRNIKITGFVTDVVSYYNAMDIFVMPSLTETTGLSTIEAMSSGIPLITTPVGIATTSISDGYNGLIFSKGDVKALTAKLEQVIKDSSLRKKLGLNARKSILEKYSWDKTSQEIKQILLDL